MNNIHIALVIASFRLTINAFPENGPNKMMKEEDGGKGSL